MFTHNGNVNEYFYLKSIRLNSRNEALFLETLEIKAYRKISYHRKNFGQKKMQESPQLREVIL